MRESKPLVSVIMPAYNAGKFIDRAVESILDQTFKDFEFIIIDDGSEDDTWNVIQKFAKKDRRIVSLRNEKNLNISNSLNRGLGVAKGEYIARMDADDWSYPYRLQRQYDFMVKNHDIVVLGSGVYFCDHNFAVLNEREYPTDDKTVRRKIFRFSPFCHAVVFMRSDAVRKAGGYNPDLYDAEDYDLYFRMGKIGKLRNLPEVLYKVRTYPTSVSQIRTKRQEILALFIRIRAVMEYGYKMNIEDWGFFFTEVLIGLLVPAKFKFKLFSFFRSKHFI